MSVCKQVLESESHVIAHAMYHENSSLFKSLVDAQAIERRMAMCRQIGRSDNPRDHLSFSHLGATNSLDILQKLVDNVPETFILQALAAVDLFLVNRAPDLYNNDAVLAQWLPSGATRWYSTNSITDYSMWQLVVNLESTLSTMELPPVIETSPNLLCNISNFHDLTSLCNEHSHGIRSDLDWTPIVDDL